MTILRWLWASNFIVEARAGVRPDLRRVFPGSIYAADRKAGRARTCLGDFAGVPQALFNRHAALAAGAIE